MATIPADIVTAVGPRDAFADRGFSIFWFAALVSNIGSWMQNLAVPYVIYEATRSVSWVGVTAVFSLLPSVPFSPIGGMLADRYPRRKVLIVTQVLFAIVAMGLWFEWRAGWRNPWALIAPVALASCLSGINMPSWQAFIYDLVPARILAPAVALNSAQFHLSRAIGPVIAGFVLARFGASWTFLANAISFITVIGALLVLRPEVVPRPRAVGGVWLQTREAARYSKSLSPLRTSFMVMGTMAFFGHPVLSLATPIAREVFHSGARGVGGLTAGFGAGAGAGVVLFTQASQRFRRGALVQLGMTVYAVLLVCVAMARTLPMMFLTLFPFGSVYLMVVATCNTTIQLVTAERFRGRVLALYFACFGVCYPLGALLQSWVADHIGLRTTVFFAGLVLCGIVAVWRRGGWLARAVEGTLS